MVNFMITGKEAIEGAIAQIHDYLTGAKGVLKVTTKEKLIDNLNEAKRICDATKERTKRAPGIIRETEED